MTDTPDKLPALEAVAWMYLNQDSLHPVAEVVTIERWPAHHRCGWTETPLADLNRANEIIAGLDAEIARLREALELVLENSLELARLTPIGLNTKDTP